MVGVARICNQQHTRTKCDELSTKKKQTDNTHINVTLGRILLTIIAVEEQGVLHVVSVFAA
jgi:hypothetical protein